MATKCSKGKSLTAAKGVARTKAHYTGDLRYSNPKRLEVPTGLFNFPEDNSGKKDHGKRKFVVFYCDTEADYERLVGALARKVRGVRVPYMDTTKLLALVESLEVNKDGRKKIEGF